MVKRSRRKIWQTTQWKKKEKENRRKAKLTGKMRIRKLSNLSLVHMQIIDYQTEKLGYVPHKHFEFLLKRAQIPYLEKIYENVNYKKQLVWKYFSHSKIFTVEQTKWVVSQTGSLVFFETLN